MTTQKQNTTRRKKPETKPKGKETRIEIPTNGITSGKSELSIFNLTFKGKKINTPFFPLLTGKPSYDYDHHIDGERLETMKGKHEGYTFFSYDKRGETENHKNITIQSYQNGKYKKVK